MGRESGAVKARTCKNCQHLLFATSKEMDDHARLCLRASEIGLILPGVLGPDGAPQISLE